MTVFNFGELQELFVSDPATALQLLSKDVETGMMHAKLKDVQAISGGVQDGRDTVRLIIDLDLRLIRP